MPPHPKPRGAYDYSLADEIDVLRAHRRKREVPIHPRSQVVIATWNLANLGCQDRRDKDYALIAEIISWFDLVALQEIRDNLDGLRAILRHLPKSWTAVFTDRSGNDERLTFLYRTDRVAHRELIGEIDLLPEERKRVRLPGVDAKFEDFSRSPALCSFESGSFRFSLGNVHVYYGSASGKKLDRRRLEVLALGIYANGRQRRTPRYDEHLMIIGDFNTPKEDASDPVFAALLRGGLVPPQELGAGTAVGGDTQGFHTAAYDHLVMVPNPRQRLNSRQGVFDLDTVLFAKLWSDTNKAQQDKFFTFMRYYMSDHRLLWTAFDT